MKLSDLRTEEFSANNGGYINKLPKDLELLKSFHDDYNTILDLFQSIPQDKWDYKYAPEKWSV